MKWMKSVLPCRYSLLLIFIFLCSLSAVAEDQVSVYDDFDDGRFGRSEYRSVLRTVKLEAFNRSETLPVLSPALDEDSFLTAVVLSARDYKALQPFMDKRGRIAYHRKGLEFVFSLEKPDENFFSVLDEYYRGKWAAWLDPVTKHYRENYIIRIHSAENIFEPWNDTISYTEAMLMATVIGDTDQWLWGIHDGLNLIFP